MATSASVDFATYAETLIGHLAAAYSPGQGRVSIETRMNNLPLSVDQATACGMILNELVSNALKHAYPPNASGLVRVTFAPAGESCVRLSVTDYGVGLPEGFKETGRTLGMQILTTLVRQIDGELHVIRQNGTTFSVVFPLADGDR